jgi:membrane carboxypeptidase/penicillin-binding protein
MASQIWTGVMTNVHENLMKTNFDKPKNVQEVVVCKDSGKRANGGCRNTYIEYFRKGTVPNDKCDKH